MGKNSLQRWLVPFLTAVLLVGCLPQTAASRPTSSPTVAASATTAATATQVATATAQASPTPTCQQEQGRLEQASYRSQVVSRDVPLWLYLPPCYPLDAEQLSPVFFFHGKPFDQTHWLSLELIATYEAGLSTGRWRRALLVFPNIPEPLFSQSDGGPGSYEQEFMEVVLPEIESRFVRVSTGLEPGLAGISRGGIWALEIGMRHPEVFGRVAALSPSLAVNYPRPSYDPFELAMDPSNQPSKLLLLAGDQDWALDQTMHLADRLEDQGAPVEMEVVPGAHQDPTWQQALPLVLDFLTPPIQP